MLDLRKPLKSGVEYEIWLARDDGTRLTMFDHAGKFEFVTVANDVGRFSIALPPDLDSSFLQRDRRVEFWRAPAGGRLQRAFVGFLRRWKWRTTSAGAETLTLYGPDANDLLARRIVAYDAEDSRTDRTDQADDMMKHIIYDNLAGSAASARDLTGAGLAVEGFTDLGPSISLSFAWRPVLRTLQQIADIAADNGTAVYFAIQPTGNGFIFKTWIGQPGQERTFPVFGLEYGNMESPELEMDYSREVNYVYGMGQGLGASRSSDEQEDTARSGASMWNRCEAVEDIRHLLDSALLQSAAERALEAGQGRRTFSARISDSANTRFGRDWQWGDKLPVVYRDVHLDAVVTRLLVRVDANGRERLDAGLRVVD